MDPERRKKLEARRQALKAKLASPLHKSPITENLRIHRVSFEPSHGGLWTPAYLGISSSRIDWSRSPPAAEYLQSNVFEDRANAIRGWIERLASPDDMLHFFYEYHYNGLDIAQSDALDALELLLDSQFEIWITARPKNWLIEIDRHGIVRLALPPSLSRAEAQAIAERQQAYIRPLVEPLRELGLPVSVFARDDPAGPDQPRGIVIRNWRERKRTIGLPLKNGDYEGLATRLRDFLHRAEPVPERIAYDLGYDDSPVVVLQVKDMLSHPKFLMAPLYAKDENRSVDVLLSSFMLFPYDGSWAVRIVIDGPRWKVESTTKFEG